MFQLLPSEKIKREKRLVLEFISWQAIQESKKRGLSREKEGGAETRKHFANLCRNARLKRKPFPDRPTSFLSARKAFRSLLHARFHVEGWFTAPVKRKKEQGLGNRKWEQEPIAPCMFPYDCDSEHLTALHEPPQLPSLLTAPTNDPNKREKREKPRA